MKKKQVSVITPTYNRASFLPECIHSVLNQSYENWELLIIDDGSTDETKSICETFASKDSRIKYYAQDRNTGPSKARNRAITLAKGEFIAFLDSDDIAKPDRLSLEVEALENCPSASVVYSDLTMIDEIGKELGEFRLIHHDPKNFLPHLYFRMDVILSTVMVRRECFETCAFDESLPIQEDYDLCLHLAKKYNVIHLAKSLTYFRRHKVSLSAKKGGFRESELQVVKNIPMREIEESIKNSTLSADQKTELYGKILYNREEFEAASQVFMKIDSALAKFYLGNCYLKLGKNASAVQSYRHSLELDPSHAATLNNLGVALFDKNPQAAASDFKQALKLNSSYIDPKNNLKAIETGKIPCDMTFKELRRDLLAYH